MKRVNLKIWQGWLVGSELGIGYVTYIFLHQPEMNNLCGLFHWKSIPDCLIDMIQRLTFLTGHFDERRNPYQQPVSLCKQQHQIPCCNRYDTEWIVKILTYYWTYSLKTPTRAKMLHKRRCWCPHQQLAKCLVVWILIVEEMLFLVYQQIESACIDSHFRFKIAFTFFS